MKIVKSTVMPEHEELFNRCLESPDIYYFCRKLQMVGEVIPEVPTIDIEVLRPLLIRHGWMDEKSFKINVREYSRILDELGKDR